jgi:CDP-4-dehydro-6-deoxyglucose reductase
MPSPEGAIKLTWRGIPREEIHWHPTVEHELCIGCGICVIGCGKEVYKFDFEKNVPVVANPLNCLVGCTTCENTCPQHAISFPSMPYLHKMMKKRGLIQRSKKDLASNKAKYEPRK